MFYRNDVEAVTELLLRNKPGSYMYFLRMRGEFLTLLFSERCIAEFEHTFQML